MTNKLKTPRSASTHSTQDVKARRDGSHAADYRAAEAQRHSQRISDSQHTQITIPTRRPRTPGLRVDCSQTCLKTSWMGQWNPVHKEGFNEGINAG